MKFLVAFIILWTTAGSSPLSIDGRISNGVGALVGQLPYMALLQIELGGGYKRICGGALISSRWILTAAHCIDNPGNGNVIHIYLGVTYTEEADIDYVVWSPNVARVHPFWRSAAVQNDIALIEIPETPICSKIRPVQLPPLNSMITKPSVGEIGVVSGWGKTNTNSEISTHLLWGHMKVANNEFCRAQIPWIGKTQICADTTINFVATCDGDSGGPFVSRSTGELLGIVSYTIGEQCQDGDPVVMTRVTPYLQWIKSITGISY